VILSCYLAALDGATPVVGPAPMAAPEGPTTATIATPEGATSAAGPAPMAALEGLTPTAGPALVATPKGSTPASDAALEGVTLAAGVGPPLPFPGRRTGREQGRDLDAGPPLPPLGPPVTVDGCPRPTCITGNPFRITWLMLKDGMNIEIDLC
jgi:hypothetical protein